MASHDHATYADEDREADRDAMEQADGYQRTDATAPDDETTESAGFSWSDDQTATFSWFKHPPHRRASLVVIARAGTGKTTTILEAVRHAPERKILIAAFNKSIATELTEKLQTKGNEWSHVQAKTLHSLGFAFVRKNWNNVRLASNGERATGLAASVTKSGTPKDVVKLIANLMTKGREIVPHATSADGLTDLCYRFDCDPDETMIAQGYDAAFICNAACKAMALAAKGPTDGVMDFTDMIFLPVRNGWVRPWFDLVAVDEAQDMNPAQIELAQKACRGRFVCIGDDCQAIYGFRGADSDVLHRIAKGSKATVLSLKTTYRCASSIVAKATRYVPDFKCGPSNPVGTVDSLSTDKLRTTAQPTDAILSRTNAPLITLALQYLADGIPAFIRGRDAASGLTALITKVAGKSDSLANCMASLAAWERKESARLSRLPEAVAESKLEAMHNKVEAIYALSEGADTVTDLHRRIARIFDEISAGRAIVLSTIHKAKGLEWDRVFILADTLRHTGGEEDNINYVAITRAKSHLTMVS
jgi:superfamily I DNA/RNA helicase